MQLHLEEIVMYQLKPSLEGEALEVPLLLAYARGYGMEDVLKRGDRIRACYKDEILDQTAPA